MLYQGNLSDKKHFQTTFMAYYLKIVITCKIFFMICINHLITQCSIWCITNNDDTFQQKVLALGIVRMTDGINGSKNEYQYGYNMKVFHHILLKQSLVLVHIAIPWNESMLYKYVCNCNVIALKMKLGCIIFWNSSTSTSYGLWTDPFYVTVFKL